MSPPRRAGLIGFAVLLAAGAVAAWTIQPPPAPVRTLSGLSGDVARGAYVARLAGCIACHTDRRGGGAVLAGGTAIETPYGRFFGPNITPHPDSGIGRWSLEDFALALTAGVSPDGRHYYPAFPYTFYTRLSDQDIVDLWAAVRSVPAVDTASKDHDLAFPFSMRNGLRFWQGLFLEPEPLAIVAGKSDEWARGRYLAEAAAHCGACHTPRNLLGGRIASQRYAGVRGGEESVPAIDAASLIAEGCTPNDLAFALRSGIMPDGDTFGGSMVEVVREGTQFWSEEDLMAIAAYLLSSPVED